MKLTTEALKSYEEQGFLFIPECFSREEISVICDQIPNVMDDEAVGRVLEDDQMLTSEIINFLRVDSIFMIVKIGIKFFGIMKNNMMI